MAPGMGGGGALRGTPSTWKAFERLRGRFLRAGPMLGERPGRGSLGGDDARAAFSASVRSPQESAAAIDSLLQLDAGAASTGAESTGAVSTGAVSTGPESTGPESTGAESAGAASAGLESAYDEQEVSCCAAVQTKRWFVDPDGRPWEVYVVLDDSDAVPTFPAKPAQSLAGVAGGCCGTKPAANAEVDASGGCCA